MKKNYIILLLNLILAFSLRSQNLPYLNASTGNANQSIADKDTNLYMFHGSRLEKLNKSLVPVWVNTYSNITFSNILLSKTGSIFFIAQSKVGKIKANGNVEWISFLNNITTNSLIISSIKLNQFFLDRNNNVIITGIGQNTTNTNYRVFVKMDTLGNILKVRLFSYSNPSNYTSGDNFNIISDSAGNYKLYADEVALAGRVGYLLNYSETLDSVTISKELAYFDAYNSSTYGQPVFFYKSKFGSNFYVCSNSKNNINQGHLQVSKFNPVKGAIASYDIGTWGLDGYFENFNEDEKGNFLISGRTVTNGGMNYDRGCEILDSNCIRISGVKFLSNYSSPTNPPFGSINNKLHILYNNNYFFDASGAPFPSNPLTISSLNNNLSCYASMPIGSSQSCTTASCFAGIPVSNITVTSASISLIPPFTPTAMAITNFSISQNYCDLLLNTKTELIQENTINIYPNPFSRHVVVSNNGFNTLKLEIYNSFGELIKVFACDTNSNEINLEELNNGIYFVKINSNNKTYIKKIMKN